MNEYIIGNLVGLNQILIGYPFDTLKTRKQIYQNHTLRDLYKMGNLFQGLSITLLS